jgi:hypothetical protein
MREGAVLERGFRRGASGRSADGCGKRGPLHRKTPPWRAERRCIVLKRDDAIDYLTRFLGAPSPLFCAERKSEYGLPGAAKNTGGEALAKLFDN